MSANKKQRSGGAVGRGRPSGALLDDRVRAALRSLDDPIALEMSSLVLLPSVQHLATGQLRGRTCAEGLALRFVLRKALQQIATDLAGTPVSTLAAAIHAGRSQASAARQMAVSEEHLSRRWKPVLVSLVRERIEQMDEVSLAA